MNKNKQVSYEAPTTNVLELRFESGILTISGGDPGAAGGDLIKGNSFDFGDDD